MSEGISTGGINMDTAKIEPDPATVAGHPDVRKIIEQTDEWAAEDPRRDVPRLTILTEGQSMRAVLIQDYSPWPEAVCRLGDATLALRDLHGRLHEDPMGFPSLSSAIGFVLIGQADMSVVKMSGEELPLPDSMSDTSFARIFMVRGHDGSTAVMVSTGSTRTWYQGLGFGEMSKEFSALVVCLFRADLLKALIGMTTPGLN